MSGRVSAAAGLAALLALALLSTACSTSFNPQVEAAVPLPSVTPAPSPAADPTTEVVPTPTAVANGETLTAGECFTAEELQFVDGTPVRCTRPHVAEFFAVMQRSEPQGAPWPGLEVVQDEASDFCNDQFRISRGVAGQISALDILFFRPDPDSWDEGEREVTCFVQYPEPTSQPLAGIDPMRAFGLVSTFGLASGDCVADPTLVETVTVTLVGCDTPHWYEVYSSVAMDSGPFPGTDLVQAFVGELCDASFERFVGIPRLDSELMVERLFPTQESWEAWDDRLVTCVITSDEERVESAAGAGV